MISIEEEEKKGFIKNHQHKMNLYCIKCLQFTKNNDIKMKGKIGGKINLYYYCIDCGFKNFETIDEKEISNLLKCKLCIK